MAKLAIRFRPGEIRLLEHAPEGLAPRQHVVYELDGGLDCRPVTIMANAVAAAHGELLGARFVRVASETDLAQLEVKTAEEVKAHAVCLDKILEHRLPMKLVDAIYTLDFSRLTFLYTSEGRVDFRELLKDLTSTFKRTRILLRQIGVRDEAKHLSGVGPCGKELCCSTFIKEFMPINIKLAKDQDLSLNPAKLSGACGRLKCCLSYEVEAYRAAKRQLPRQGARVLTAEGEGRVLEVQAANERALVELADGRVVAFGPEAMNVLANDHPGGPVPGTEGGDARPFGRGGRPQRGGRPPRFEAPPAATDGPPTSAESRVRQEPAASPVTQAPTEDRVAQAPAEGRVASEPAEGRVPHEPASVPTDERPGSVRPTT